VSLCPIACVHMCVCVFLCVLLCAHVRVCVCACVTNTRKRIQFRLESSVFMV